MRTSEFIPQQRKVKVTQASPHVSLLFIEIETLFFFFFSTLLFSLSSPGLTFVQSDKSDLSTFLPDGALRGCTSGPRVDGRLMFCLFSLIYCASWS